MREEEAPRRKGAVLFLFELARVRKVYSTSRMSVTCRLSSKAAPFTGAVESTQPINGWALERRLSGLYQVNTPKREML